MAIRTTEQEVKDVLAPGGDYKPGKPVEPFMAAGNSVVNWIQANAADYGLDPLSTADARILETWLAAFYYKCSDQQLSSKSQGRASGSMRGATGGKGFEMNNYGSAAKTLDGTGLLTALDDGKIVGTAWLGKLTQEMLTWDERNTE